MTGEEAPSRRQYLRGLGAAVGLGACGALAGCGGLFETRSVRSPPLVEDRPDAVYVPSHVEGMQMVGMAKSGRLRLALTYSFPHRFWLIDGEGLTNVQIQGTDALHLMVSVWDAETGMVIPASNPTVSATKDGESVLSGRSMWRMLSQNMGVHFGDNVALDGGGTYEVTVDYGPVGTRRTGVFQDAFGERISRSFTLEYSQSKLEEISFRRLEERQGERDAVPPMQMDAMPVPRIRPAASMPGTLGAQGTSADARFVARVLEDRPEGIDGRGPYLYVSPRTPYNRYPLPNTSLDATLSRDGATLFEGPLTPTLSPTLDYHYGAAIDDASAGDALTVTPLLPPQVSRHEGYETAFLDMPALDLTLDSV